MDEITQEQKNKIMVAAQAFFRDGEGDDEYPHKDVSEQYDEFYKMIKNGEMSWHFIDTVYRANK